MSKRIDMTGQKYGIWTVLQFSRHENNRTYWLCRCDCGTEKEIDGHALRSGHTQSCGCYNADKLRERFTDLTGQKIGYWTVIEKRPNRGKHIMWLCRCECGNEREVASSELISKSSTSCGCKRIATLKKKFTKHGMRDSRLYDIYSSMLKRCFNHNCKAYGKYGGAGITVCNEWLGDRGFENFMIWALENGYSDELTLDRFPDQKGNYEPSNCRWATMQEQSNNRSTNVYITRNGEKHTLAEWSRIFNLNYGTVVARYDKGWDEDKLFIPVKRANAKKNH